MKLFLDGNIPINRYYVQMLCMIYYPGMTFSESEDEEQSITLTAKVERAEDNVTATLTLVDGEKQCTAAHSKAMDNAVSEDKAMKLAIGGAMYKIGSEMLDYRPSWGMLTGVRPSKVATEFLSEGNSKTRVKKILTTDYMATPKKAQLAIDVALAEKEIIGAPKKRDCSVYISVPFCPTRCAYCSFVSYTSRRLLSLIPEYTVRLCHDIERTFALIDELKMNVKTVYIGGGTPTILTAEQLEAVLSTVARCTDVSKLEEYTLEGGRPDTIDDEKVAVAVKYGVTRMSVNPQTLNDTILCGVGRCHSKEDFFRAYDIVRAGGIKYINTDLIAGLPGDRFKIFSDSFKKILELEPDNITIHTFCVKKSAELKKQGPEIFSVRGGETGKCIDYSQLKAVQSGYKPYYMYRQKNSVGNFENVGFAKPGSEGLYNIYMMEEVHTIFAAGAGAVTKLVEYDDENWKRTRIKRLFSHKYPYEYLASDNFDQIASESREFFADVPLD